MILNKLTSNTFVSLLIRENLIPYATKCKEVIEQCSRNSILCTRNNRYGTAQEKLSYKMKFLFCLLFGDECTIIESVVHRFIHIGMGRNKINLMYKCF